MFQRILKLSISFELAGRHRLRCLAGALLLAVLPAPACATATADAPLRVAVDNPLALARSGEVLELPLAEIWRRRPAWRTRELAVREEGHARWLPAQRYASDGAAAPDQLLVQLDLAPRAAATLEILPAPDAAARAANPLYARSVPERDDDFAWENDRVAFRIYGPALAAKGELSSGIDVWSKRPGRQVIDAWYRRDAEGLKRGDPSLSYHVDRGDGLDSYAVGHSPGTGGTAAWRADGPAYSGNAARVRITAMGPMRLRFEVEYAPWHAGKVVVRERKVVTLDAGSHLNRQVATYRFEGASHLSIGAGVTVHAGAETAHDGASRIAVWDTPQKPRAGRIATALVLPAGEAARYVAGHGAAWALFDVADGGSVRFASGAGWQRGDVPDFGAWKRYLDDYRLRWAHPLRVRWPDPPPTRRRGGKPPCSDGPSCA